MAISVPIPKEITEYEEKIMFGLSLRKLVCFSSAVVLGVGTYFLCTKVLGLTMDTASYIIIAEAMPLMAFGFIKKDGMTFEKYAALLIRHKTGMNKLSYENELVIDALPDLADETAERKSKYAWIFEKETGSAGTGKQLTRKKPVLRRTALISPIKICFPLVLTPANTMGRCYFCAIFRQSFQTRLSLNCLIYPLI